jgi:hypothetical protein
MTARMSEMQVSRPQGGSARNMFMTSFSDQLLR